MTEDTSNKDIDPENHESEKPDKQKELKSDTQDTEQTESNTSEENSFNDNISEPDQHPESREEGHENLPEETSETDTNQSTDDPEEKINDVESSTKDDVVSDVNADAESEKSVEVQESESKKVSTTGESNYQISLINENELTVKVKTLLPVEIESTSKEVSNQELSQKLVISKARHGSSREIEIKIKILDDGSVVYNEADLEPGKLIPNPEVADLIIPEEERELTPEEKLSLKIGKNSPHNIFKKIYEKNFKIGLVSSIIIYLVLVIAFAAYGRKQSTPTGEDVKTRLVILQDIPTRVNLENLKDPQEPEEVAEDDSKNEGIVPRRIPPRRNVFRPRTPTVRTETDTTQVGVERDTTGKGDLLADTTGAGDTVKTSAGELTQTFSENEIGLIMNYPPQWYVIPNTQVDPNRPFEGLMFADSTLSPGDLNIFINLDNESKVFNRDKFTDNFEMDREEIIAYSSKPLNEGGDISFEYYIFLQNHKIHVTVRMREQYYDKKKELIENSLRTLYIEDKLPKEG